VRVGILAPQSSEQIGGGHTFEHEIFERTLEVASGSKHQFVVFEGLNGRRANIPLANVERVCLKEPLPALVQRTMRKIARTLRIGARRDWYLWQNKWIADVLRRQKIEFFLNISPLTLSLEVPFLAVVWDLQHRLQPFFPEVSTGGRWQMRENDFSQVLQRATYVITGTQAGKNEIQLFYGVTDERIRVVPLPTPRFALQSTTEAASLASYNLPSDFIFYPAQFWSHKNHVALLRAVAQLKQTDNLRIPVVFTGSDQGNERYVRQVVEDLQLKQQIHFLGYVPRETLRSLYQNAVALCYPSFFGPENLPPLEAFACGCPVIAANVPGAAEQLGGAAVLVNPADESEIAGAIKSIYSDKAKRDDLIRRGKERARRFTGSDFAKTLLGLLDEFARVRRCWPADSHGRLGL
jgi:glycosyltransferase involved in cell wall biosynthesis